MAEKFKLPEEDILAKVQSAVRGCINWTEGRLSKERERVIGLYDQRLPKRESAGNSSYISSDVYDGVESMKAQLLETFAGGHEIVKFKPRGAADVVPARIETKVVEEVIFADNNGFGVFHDVIDDSLKARRGVVSVYWEDQSTYEDHEFDQLGQMEVDALAASEDVDSLEADMIPGSELQGGIYSGKFTVKLPKGKCCIEPTPPEEFYIEEGARKREDATRGRRTLKTKAELLEMGYDPKKVAKVQREGKRLSDTAEALEREADIGATSVFASEDAIQEELQEVELHVTYIKLSLKKGDDKAQLYRVVHAANVLFEIEEADEDEFVDFAALPKAHSWFGSNFADRIKHTQNARTALTRGILDHTALTIHPRWQVVQGGLMNPKEMLDQRRGGLVNITRPDAITPLQYANLNPFVFETLNMLKENKEEQTGISALSQGLNKDAISKQNSQGLIGDLVALSQVRQKVIARFFANDFLVPLFLKVHRELRQYGKPMQVELDGQWIEVDPRQWPERSAVNVSLHLGYGEQEKEAAKYVSLYQNLAADPGLGPLFGPEQRRNLAVEAAMKNGIFEMDRFLAPAEQYKAPEPDPIEMKKAEAALINAQAAMKQADAITMKHGSAAQQGVAKLQTDAMKAAATAEKQARDADRQDLDTANRIDISQREMELVESSPFEGGRAIASPNS
jgi:hypothetical protein